MFWLTLPLVMQPEELGVIHTARRAAGEALADSAAAPTQLEARYAHRQTFKDRR
jgi:hypothetical protein